MLKKSDGVRMMGKRAINKWVLMADYLIAAILVRKVAVVFGGGRG